jgi:dienelactone hydrolase
VVKYKFNFVEDVGGCVETLKVEYSVAGTLFEAFIAYKKSLSAPLPAVCVFPAWNGREHFAEEKARALAELGYVGCAMDVYGKGVVGRTAEECSRLMNPLMQDRHILRERLLAGLKCVSSLAMVDKDKIGAIGFCFGGLCALDLARSGALIKGVVSFHGLLRAPKGFSSSIHAKVLALHGFDDPMVLPSEVLAFEEEMTSLKVDWQLHAYGQTMHAFTNPTACDEKSGLMYSAQAERRSWRSMKDFFYEVFS